MKCMGFRLVLLLTLCVSAIWTPSDTSAQRIGVYGPGDDLSAPYFPPGSSYTLISEATWNRMTTADFAAYDIIWIEAANCTSTNVQATAVATQATWSAAVDGRITFASGDLDYHASRNNARARDFVARLVNYLSAGGGTASLSRRSVSSLSSRSSRSFSSRSRFSFAI